MRRVHPRNLRAMYIWFIFLDTGPSTSVSALKPTLVLCQEMFKHLLGQSVLSKCFAWTIVVMGDYVPLREPQVTVA